MSKFINKVKDINEIDISNVNKIWEKYLNNYAGKNKCILENKEALMQFFKHINVSLEVYNKYEMECIVAWICEQYLYVYNLTDEEKDLVIKFVYKFAKYVKDRKSNDKILNRIILNSPSTRCPILISRGVKSDYYLDPKYFQNDIHTMNQATSTSLNINTSFMFSHYFQNKCCMMIMSLPAGSKGLIIFTDIIKKPKGAKFYESEIILPAGTKLHLIKKDDNLNYKQASMQYNLKTTFWKGIANIEMIMDLIKQFKADPSEMNFYALPVYIQKLFILKSREGIKQGIGDQEVMKQILKY